MIHSKVGDFLIFFRRSGLLGDQFIWYGQTAHTKVKSTDGVWVGMDSASPRQTESLVDSSSDSDALTFTIKLAENFTVTGTFDSRAFERLSHPTFEPADPSMMGADRPHVSS